MTLRIRPVALALALASVFAAPAAQAADLAGTWRAARLADPQTAVARLSAQAGVSQRAQAAALGGPTVVLSGAAGMMGSDTTMRGAQFSAPGLGQSSGVGFSTSVNPGAALRWTVTARQPLYNRELSAQTRQLQIGADARDLEFAAAEQALMLRTAQRYFDVALAQESLRVLRHQQAAAERSLTEVRDRYRLGDAPVTGTHEANARARALGAQVLAAEADLGLRQAQLADLTGLPADRAPVRVPASAQPRAPEGTLEQALARASDAHPALRAQALGVEVARQEAAKFSSGASPVAELIASAGHDRLAGHGDFGSASNTSTTTMLGVQVTVPLYTGGYRDARRDEARLMADRAGAQLEQARIEVTQQARAAWSGVTVGAVRIDALSQALAASQARLDATRLGQEVGDRTTMDLLNAQNDLAQAELALTQARAALLLDGLRLRLATGALDEAALQAVDAFLQEPAGF